MARYVIAPRAADFLELQPVPPLPHPTVWVTEPVFTGLVDQGGQDICRVSDVIGFLRLED